MDAADIEILREARETRQRKESVERAVGRTVRRRALDFAVYVRLMSELREFASSKRVDLDVALAALVEEEQQAD